ncbi:hypothetical protein [Streptomyces sp. 2A115]|uniref:hypothetical protein n=1 Tax=Streptomyces sp. 2A115 TaxID=3457439 RepID=UPI003FD30C17
MTDQQNTASAGGAQLVGAPGRPARSFWDDSQRRPECRHWIGDERQFCKEANGVRLFIPGRRCPLHTPAALQGKPEPQPGPGWPIFRKEAT